ncbi:unnamed protein product [Phytophthora fragariaefolia]|uniref:Unnamed protein product n=1 Tax=Phytophthora fragariaefolia TaxID=1490495 RepID=A0A9W7D341_9STRA|nr:unnamed protein product [Phytophthora fragariaefolia]
MSDPALGEMKRIESNYHQFHVAGADLQQKLTLALSSESRSEYCQLRSRCYDVKTAGKRALMLVIFHLLNVLVTIGGLVGVGLLLTGLLINLLWAVGLLLVGIAMIPFMLLDILPGRRSSLKVLGNTVMILLYFTLYIASCFSIYTVIAPYVLMFGGGLGLVLFYISFLFVAVMVNADTRLGNFVAISVPSTLSPEDRLQPEGWSSFNPGDRLQPESRSCFNHLSDIGQYLPVIDLPRRIWITIGYFAVLKVIVGTLSAVAIFLSVIQPAVALFGNDILFITWVFLNENPVAYFIAIGLIWIIGVVIAVLVAAMSSWLTSRVFGESTIKQSQCDNDLEVATA